MRISFHGAAGGVTGSCHLLDTGRTRVLVDCGLFQGSRELREENGKDFGFDPVLWCGNTASQRGQDNFLRGVRCLSGKLNKRR